MNIFVLDRNPMTAATYHCDKHVVKMVLETAQILSTVLKETNTTDDTILYRSTHKNHPAVKWARESKENYRWLVELGKYLSAEYTYRYGKVHKSDKVIQFADSYWKEISSVNETKLNIPINFVQVMPDKYKSNDTVQSYRNYYMGEKAHFATWTKREEPYWWFDNESYKYELDDIQSKYLYWMLKQHSSSDPHNPLYKFLSVDSHKKLRRIMDKGKYNEEGKKLINELTFYLRKKGLNSKFTEYLNNK